MNVYDIYDTDDDGNKNDGNYYNDDYDDDTDDDYNDNDNDDKNDGYDDGDDDDKDDDDDDKDDNRNTNHTKDDDYKYLRYYLLGSLKIYLDMIKKHRHANKKQPIVMLAMMPDENEWSGP